MDGSTPRSSRGNRQSYHQRVPSHTGPTVVTDVRASPRMANSPSSHMRTATPPSSHQAHRYHHSNCGKSSTTPRPSSRLARQTSHEGRASSASASAFLQEMLQRERQAGGDRVSGNFDRTLSSPINEIRDNGGLASPIKRSATAGLPQATSSLGDDNPSQEPGMGLREMEQTVSTLHKQNFDLKLELFHRRERQTALEDQLEKVESEHQGLLNANEELANDVEKRDKAIGEAVTMIVGLEAKVDELLREREMVRHVELGGAYVHSDSEQVTPSETLVAPELREPPRQDTVTPGQDKLLARQPSFLSERTDQTATLRSVVLQNQQSMSRMSSRKHLRQISESSADPSDINRIASPSLSILSESSFVSIYGPKNGQKATPNQQTDLSRRIAGTVLDKTWALPNRKRADRVVDDAGAASPQQQQRSRQSMSRRSPSLSTQVQSLDTIIGLGSPIQNIEMFEKQHSVADDRSRPSTSGRGQSMSIPSPGGSSISHDQSKTKQDKRDTLHKVMTNIPPGREIGYPHALPPTPDTVSSSLIRKHNGFGSSQDSLQRRAAFISQGSNATLSGDSTFSGGDQRPTSRDQSATSTKARNHAVAATNSQFFADLASHRLREPLRRPRSAGETTTTRSRANSFDSDSDSDGGADARSGGCSSLDYWQRESLRPNRVHPSQPTQRRRDRPPSPDLFSFPASSRGCWESEVIYGALDGQGMFGAPPAGLRRDPLAQAAARKEQPQVPRAPNDTSVSAPLRDARRNIVRIPGFPTKARSNSIDSAAKIPSPRLHQRQPSGQTAKQYPPMTSQAPRSKGLGFNSLFRRSNSEYQGLPTNITDIAPQPANQTQKLGTDSQTGRSTVPPPPIAPWARQDGLFEEDKGATPPPIMRTRPTPIVPGEPQVHAGQDLDEAHNDINPTSPTEAQQTNQTSNSTGVRKWLGLGRRGSLKNRS